MALKLTESTDLDCEPETPGNPPPTEFLAKCRSPQPVGVFHKLSYRAGMIIDDSLHKYMVDKINY